MKPIRQLTAFISVLQTFLQITNSQNAKPHILMMVVDDLGWTDISYHGAIFSTPNIDALFSNGVELTNYYVQPTCSPTRSAFMTGKYPWKTGLQFIGTIAPGTTEHIPFEYPTMAELLSLSGYQTHAVGKWHLGYASFNMTPTGRGFRSHFGYYQGEETYYDHHFWYEQPALEGFDFWSNKKVYFDAIGNYSTSLYQNQIEYLLSNNVNTDPLFIYLAFQTIHIPVLNFDGTPENPPIVYDECLSIIDIGRQTFCNKIKYLDYEIGEIIQLYHNYSLYDDTLIVLTTDNGGLPYYNPNQTSVTRGISWGCNYPYRGGKATQFEGGVHGVGVLSGNLIKERNLNGTKSSILSHAVDWVATFIEGIAGDVLPTNKKFDSMNMWNAILDKSNKWNRTALYVDIEVEQRSYAMINDTLDGHRWKLINLTGAKYWDWYLCNGTVINPNTEFEHIYLFDIENDPFEENNLYQQNAEYKNIANELAEMIAQQIHSGEYYPEQDRTEYNQSFPVYHGGVWAPWLE